MVNISEFFKGIKLTSPFTSKGAKTNPFSEKS